MSIDVWDMGSGGDATAQSAGSGSNQFNSLAHPLLGNRVNFIEGDDFLDTRTGVYFDRSELIGRPFIYEGSMESANSEIVNLLTAELFDLSYSFSTPQGGESGTVRMRYGDDAAIPASSSQFRHYNSANLSSPLNLLAWAYSFYASHDYRAQSIGGFTRDFASDTSLVVEQTTEGTSSVEAVGTGVFFTDGDGNPDGEFELKYTKIVGRSSYRMEVSIDSLKVDCLPNMGLWRFPLTVLVTSTLNDLVSLQTFIDDGAWSESELADIYAADAAYKAANTSSSPTAVRWPAYGDSPTSGMPTVTMTPVSWVSDFE